ncbi:MAG TPA: three-Cys-motif partner protein TcmP [Verrucomicrobiae bacterium]|jgi:three-Cys-motif partner protein|nr:three-Cys-motif partner protein TcmP [Verrucomicrobiae bacterium]
MGEDFHDKPYDPGTLTKLRIFELYAQAWIPVFLSPVQPKFSEVHIFDFFCGPGKDSEGIHGSPLRILAQLRKYQEKGLAGWGKVSIAVHLYDENREKVAQLKTFLQEEREWSIPGVKIDCQALAFKDALATYDQLLADRGFAKLLIIDQYGVDQVTDGVFQKLIGFQTADFIFFLSSSTLHRFRDHSAIKQKIERPNDSYDVHRAAVKYYRNLIPSEAEYFLGQFSIRKRSNIYGLIFGSRHPLGIHKFLQVAWANDEIAGEANFDIDRENISPGEGLLNFEVMRPNKQREFEAELREQLTAGKMKTEADVARFCIEAGMTCQHSGPILKELKAKRIIDIDFQIPDIRNLRAPRVIRMR